MMQVLCFLFFIETVLNIYISFRKSTDLCFDYRKRDEHIDRNRERTDPEEIELEQLFGYIFTIY